MLRFDRTVVINLDRRPDRLSGFRQRFPLSSWPFGLPQQVSAIDGTKVTKPRWFTEQAGAWGCLRTHMTLIEEAINQDQNIFIFEDDAVFAPDFDQRVGPFFRAVPDDWDMIYLGGLHRLPATHPPARVNEQVHLGRGITTTFAYGLRVEFLKRVYPLLLEAEQHHIDQMWARLQFANDWKIYCPVPWLCGMDEGQSDICHRYYAVPHFWEYTEATKDEPLAILQLLSRQKLTLHNDVVIDSYEVPLTAAAQQKQLTSTIPGWFTPECGAIYRAEAQAAIERVDGNALMAEIGCWRGRSLSFLSEFIMRGDLKVFAIDTWNGNSNPKDPTHGRDVYEEFAANMRALGIWDMLNVIRLPSVQVAEGIRDEALDLAMIDADHSYPFVLADLRAWWPKIKLGGVLMGHDFSLACSCPEVVQAVTDFAGEHDLEIEAKADLWLIRKPIWIDEQLVETAGALA